MRSEKLLQNSSPEKIVKMDALTQQSPVYEMISYKMDASAQKIVKMDTLIVQFTATQDVAPKNLQKRT